jgi:hypothetical protein
MLEVDFQPFVYLSYPLVFFSHQAIRQSIDDPSFHYFFPTFCLINFHNSQKHFHSQNSLLSKTFFQT